MKSIDEQIRIISKGVDEIIGIEDLKNKLEKSQKENKPMVVKLGLDPSAPDIHLGHTVVLRKMKQLQDLGHKVIIIIGDFTGKIGDPTGKSKARKALSTEQVLENAKTYEEQILKVLDKEKTEIVFNSKWLSKLSFEEAISLAATTTVARMLEREDFKKRYESQTPISLHEFFYPLMQGFDSVEIKADIELGGTDQRFNVLMGRSLQKEFNQEPQVTIFMPLLEGLDGKDKMSKSLGNYIGVNEPANIMFKKVMEVPDSLIIKYFELATDEHPDKIDEIKNRLDRGENPRDIKLELAQIITNLYHCENEVKSAMEFYNSAFTKKEIPDDIPNLTVESNKLRDIVSNLVSEKYVSSKKEFTRLVEQGGVQINGEKINSLDINLLTQDVIKIGKKKFVKLKINA